jgi:hypothetical protein
MPDSFLGIKPKALPSGNDQSRYAAAHPGGGIGGTIGRALGFDPSPGFNVTRSTAGIPFVAHDTSPI